MNRYTHRRAAVSPLTASRRRTLSPLVSMTATVVMAWATGATACAQSAEPGQISPEQAQPIQSDAKAAVRNAYDRTKGAKTIADYTEVIDLCAKAQVIGLSDAQERYIKSLIAWAHNRRGEAYADQAAKLAEQQDGEQAAKLDAKALSDFEIAVNNDRSRWKAVHNLAVSLALVGRYDEAVKDFTRVIELKPDYENAWYNRAEIHYEIGKYEEAVADYDRTLQLKPADFGATTSRGHAYFRLKRFREALLDYIAAVRLQPNDALAYVNRADAYRSLAMWEQAARDYRRSIELDGELGRAYQGAAWLMATCPDERFRDEDRAIRAAQEAIRLDGDEDFHYLDTLAVAYANAGQFEKATTTLGQAIDNAPDDQQALLQQRMTLFKQQKPYRQAPATNTASSESQRQR